MQVNYKFTSSDEIHTAIIGYTEEFIGMGIIEKNGCIEIKKDETILFSLTPAVGDKIEEIRITNIYSKKFL